MSSVQSQREKSAVRPVVRSRSSPVKDQLGRPVARPITGLHQKPRYKTNCLSDHAPYEQLHDELSKANVKKIYDMCAADNGQNLKLLEILLGERPGVLATLEALGCKRYSTLCDLRSCLQKLNILSIAEWEQQAGAGVCDMENGALSLIRRAARFIRRASNVRCTTIECTVSIAPLAKSAKNDPNDDGDDGAEDDDDDGDDVKYDEWQPKQPTNAASSEQHICTDSVEKVFLAAEGLAAQEILKTGDRDQLDRDDDYRHFMATLNGNGECRLSKLKNVKKNARIHQQGQLSFLTLLYSILFVPKPANTLTVLQTSLNNSVKKYLSVTDENKKTFICRLNEEGDIPPQLPALSRSPALDFTPDAESKAFAKQKRDFLYWLRIHVQINRTVNEHKCKPVDANRIRNVVASLISKRCNRAEFVQTLQHRGIPLALCDALWHDLGGAPLSEIDLAVTNENENEDDGIELEQLNQEIRETNDIDVSGVSVVRNVGHHDGGRAKCVSRKNSGCRRKARDEILRQLPSCSQLKATAFNWKPCGSAWQRTALINILKDEQQQESIVSGTRWDLLPCLDHAKENASSSVSLGVEYPKWQFVGTLLQNDFTDLVLFPVYNDKEEQFMHLHALCVDSDTDTDRSARFQFAIAFEVKQDGMLHAPNEDSKDDDDDEDAGLAHVSVVGFYSNTRAIRERSLCEYLQLGNCSNLPSSWIDQTHFLNPDRLEVYENQPQSMMAMRCVQFMEACLAQGMGEKQIEDQVQILKGENYNYVPGDFKQDETLWQREMEAFARETQCCSHQWSTDVCKLWCIFTMKPTAQQQQSTMKGPKHCWYISRTAFAHKSIGPIVSKYKSDKFEIYAKHATYSVFSELKAFLGKRNNWNGESFDAFLALYGA